MVYPLESVNVLDKLRGNLPAGLWNTVSGLTVVQGESPVMTKMSSFHPLRCRGMARLDLWIRWCYSDYEELTKILKESPAGGIMNFKTKSVTSGYLDQSWINKRMFENNKQSKKRKRQKCVKEIAVSCYSPPGIGVGRSVSSLVQLAEEVRWSRSVSASPWVCVEQSEVPLRKRKTYK